MDIRGWIDRNADRILELTSDLVRYRTVNQVLTGTERDIQHYIAAYLHDSMQLEVDLFSPEDVEGFRDHPAYFPGKDYSDRPNVTGRWQGLGRGRSLVFSSHVDTALVAAGWTHDPWDPVVKDGRMYGLGVFDMKGGLAASIMAVQCLQELGVRLKGDVFIESVVDEEFGGANGTLASRLRGYEADAAIVPEPTNMAVCPASRGGALWRVTFRGNTGMSFSGESIRNPVYAAARFMTFLEVFEQGRNAEPGPAPWYVHNRSLPVMITRVEAGDMKAALCDSGPSECHVDIWVECYPGVTEEQLKQEMLDGYGDYCRMLGFEPDDDLEVHKVIRFLPGSEIAADFPLIGILADNASGVTGHDAVVQGAPFSCDAFMFNLYSPTPAVIMGPTGGNAHAPDEYIEIDEFYDLVEVYARTIIGWCGIVEDDREEGEPI